MGALQTAAVGLGGLSLHPTLERVVHTPRTAPPTVKKMDAAAVMKTLTLRASLEGAEGGIGSNSIYGPPSSAFCFRSGRKRPLKSSLAATRLLKKSAKSSDDEEETIPSPKRYLEPTDYYMAHVQFQCFTD